MRYCCALPICAFRSDIKQARKELVVGIIDVVRTYTWDKKLESWIKGMLIQETKFCITDISQTVALLAVVAIVRQSHHQRQVIVVPLRAAVLTSIQEYKNRFREAMNSYILQGI